MMKNLILTRRDIIHAVLIIAGIAAILYGATWLRVSPGDITTAPHQALYRLSLSRLRQGGSIAGVSGQMSYRIEDACDGWNVSQKFSMQFVYPESGAAWLVSDYSTFESKDGKRFQFATRRLKDGQVTEEILGKAQRSADGSGTIEYQRPRVASVALPADVLFPNQHTLKILEAAASGQKILFVPLFDGSDLSLGTDVNNVMMPAKKPYIAKVEDITPIKPMPMDDGDDDSDAAGAPPAQNLTPMTADALNHSPLINGTRAWRVRMAFYPRPDAIKIQDDNAADPDAGNDDAAADDQDLIPDYEMTMILHSNGVVSSFTLDYPDFSLDADLLSINEVARNSC
jgi:hypothetical protein